MPSVDTLATLIEEYRQSSAFPTNKRSVRNYGYALKKIEAQFGTMPILAIGARGARGVFLKWRDSMKATPRKADHDWTVLARVLSFAKDRQRIDVNPCERGGRLYEADRTDCLWTEADLGKLLSVASVEVRAVVLFALWTGQRQGDLLRLPWSAFDGQRIRLRQSKKGRHVVVPVTEELGAVIASLPRVSPLILTSSEGRPWTSDGFRTSFGRACDRAGIEGLTFHDLRGTAVTRLALAGCTTLEIASITGHGERDVAQMLEKHYLGDRAKLAEAAIIKLEARTKAVTNTVTRPGRSGHDES
jgi:integrase